jgi:hypothetical protein
MQVPPCDPDSDDFDIREASVATVIEWFRECWRTAGGETYPLAATIVGHDDFGGPGVAPLNARASTAQRE